MAFIIIGLNLSPVVFASPIGKKRWSRAYPAALDRFDPRRVREAKAFLALDESVPQVVIILNVVPIVNAAWHTNIIANMRSIVVANVLTLFDAFHVLTGKYENRRRTQ